LDSEQTINTFFSLLLLFILSGIFLRARVSWDRGTGGEFSGVITNVHRHTAMNGGGGEEGERGAERNFGSG
jgi:hypothetical protein